VKSLTRSRTHDAFKRIDDLVRWRVPRVCACSVFVLLDGGQLARIRGKGVGLPAVHELEEVYGGGGYIASGTWPSVAGDRPI
jgi:hypothetical protein